MGSLIRIRIIFLLLLIGTVTVWTQQPVVSRSPEVNSRDVYPSSTVSITLTDQYSLATVNSSSFRVWGSQSGFHTGTYSVINSGATLHFNPTADFIPGEDVSVTITTDVEQTNTLNLSFPISWTFSVATSDSGVYLGNYSYMGTGSNAAGITTADVNKDGNVDIITANQGSSNVSVFLNNSDNTVASHVTYAMGTGAYSVIAADLNSDGYPDIITGNYNANTISVRLNNGNGTFAAVSHFNTGYVPRDIAGADIDGDGDIDIVVANSDTDDLSVLKNDGTGSFAAHVTTPLGNLPAGIATADLNDDGYIDIAVTTLGADSVLVLLNSGTGTFSSITRYATGDAPWGVSLADLNGDDAADLIVANSTSHTISVRFNNGSGVFGSATDYATANNPRGVAVGDVDGDGDLDIAVAAHDVGMVSLLKNNGSGVFAAAVNHATAAGTHDVAFGDLSGDGDVDIVAASYESSTMNIIPNLYGPRIYSYSPSRASLSVTPTADIVIGFSEPMDAASITSSTFKVYGSLRGTYTGSLSYNNSNYTVTFNPDSTFFRGELITVFLSTGLQSAADLNMVMPYMYAFTVASNTGYGAFAPAANYTVMGGGGGASASAGGDFNRDGLIDIATVSQVSHTLSVFLNTGNGTLGTRTDIANGSYPRDIVSADIDGDGDLDLLTARNSSGCLSVFLNNGSGVFGTKVDYNSGINASGLVTFDLDMDGDLDVVLTDTGNDRLVINYNDGTGLFGAAVFVATGDSPGPIDAADFDRDGFMDVVSSNYSTDNASVHMNNKSGGLGGAVNHAVGDIPIGVVTGNVNGDDYFDFLVANGNANSATKWASGSGVSLFTTASYSIGNYPSSIALVNIDADYDLEMITANLNSSNISYAANNGSGVFGTASNYSLVSTPQHVFGADMNNDGRMDLVTSNDNGTVSVLMNSDGGDVVSVSPVTGSDNVAASTNVTVTFNQDMDPAAMSSATVKVIGSESGLHAGSYSYDAGTYTLTINPTNDFAPGERVTVSVTRGVEDVNNVPLTAGYTSQFIIETNSGGIYSAMTNYAMDDQPERVVVADLNNDGHPDIATANFASDNISIRLNNGDGTFGAVSSVSAGDGPSGIAAGDVDGDGDMDLVVSLANADQLARFLNNGSGVFGAASTFSTSGTPRNVVLADVDADGDHDAVYTAGSYVFYQANNGSGSFATENNGKPTSTPLGLAVADIDNDGDLDFLVVNNGNNTIGLSRFNGSNWYASTDNYTTGSAPSGIVTGDFNGDGFIDVVSTNLVSGNGTISYLQNTLTGGFATKVDYALGTGAQPRGGAALDIDGDGDLDLAIANSSVDSVVILTNNGSGSFGFSGQYAVGDNPYAVSLADIDADSDLDIITVNSSGDNISVLGGATSAPNVTTSAASNIAQTTVTLNGSINANHNATAVKFVYKLASAGVYADEIVATPTGFSNGSVTAVSAALTGLQSYTAYHFKAVGINTYGTVEGSELGFTTLEFPIAVSSTSPGMNALDVDTASNITATFNVSVLASTLNATNVKVRGSFSGPIAGSISYDDPSKTMTFNPTGYFRAGEVVTMTLMSGIQSNSTLSYISSKSYSFTVAATGTGPGFFALQTTSNFFSNSESDFIPADVDNDGDVDLIGQYYSEPITISVNNSGTLATPVPTYSRPDGSTAPGDVTYGDMDNDGYGDLIVLQSNSAPFKYAVILKNNGSGLFSRYDSVAMPSEWLYDVEVNDFNNDGKLDIAYGFGGNIVVKYNNGSKLSAGGWAASNTLTAADASYLTSADVDNDGDIDLIGMSSLGLKVLKNNGNSTFAAAVAYTGYADKMLARDLNNDGYLDLVYYGGGPKTFRVRMNNGNGTFASEVTKTIGIQPAKMVTGDLDGDGDIDLAFCYQSESYVAAAYNNGSGVFTQDALFSANLPGLSLFDYDNDGDLDILGKNWSGNVDLNILVNSTPTTPSTSTSGVSFTNDYGSQMKVNWTNGNGNGRIVVMKQGSAVTWTPSDNATYAANASFSSGVNVGDNSYVVYNGTATSITVTNLSVNTTYHIAVFEYNGLAGMEKYKTASPGTGSDQTNTVSGFPFDNTAGNAFRYNNTGYSSSNTAFAIPDGFTYELWAKPSSVGTQMVILDHGDEYVWIAIDATGKFFGRVYDDNGSNHVNITGTTTAVAGQWYHLALSGASGSPLKLYVNGVLEATSGGNIGALVTGTQWFYPGTDNGENYYYSGDLDELRLWSTVRTVDQIRGNMHKTLTGVPSQLFGYWQINEGSGSTVADFVNENTLNKGDASWVASGAPVGGATISSAAAVQNGTTTVGNATLTMANGFDNPVDVYVSEVTADPSNYPSGYGSSIGGKYFVINLFGNPGTFSANISFNFGPGVITVGQEAAPGTVKLFKRESNSSGSWTVVGGAQTAVASTGIVTWNGITSFSQFVVVSTDNAVPPSLTFEKPNEADWTLPENQDRITDNVWLTRADYYPMFNIATEGSYDDGSPQGTEWAHGKVSDGVETLTFSDFRSLRDDLDGSLQNLGGHDVVLHLLETNIYLDVHFNSWSTYDDGAGFSYTRSFLPLELKADNVSSITTSSATVSGRIYSKDGAATTRVLYGTTSEVYTDSITVPSSPITAADSLISFSANLASLSQGTEYFVRISAHNGTRYWRSAELSFSTDTALAVNIASATNVLSTTATVNGYVNSDGLTATAKILYGTSSGVYSDSVAVTPGSIDAGTLTSVSAGLSSLTPGALYYYVVAAANSSYYKRSNEGTFLLMSSHAVNALRFDGDNDRIQVANESDFDFTTAVTLEAWIKPATVSGTKGIITKNSGDGAHPYQVRLEDDEITFGFYSDGINWNPLTTSNANLVAGEWVHIACTYDMTNAKIYVNGVQKASTTDFTFSIPLNNQPLEIGRTGGGDYFSGSIEEVRVWNVARTQQQIQDNMRLPFTSAQSGLIGYWQFNASSGSLAQNHGTGGNGTLLNFNFNSNSGWVSSDAMIGPLAITITDVSNVSSTAATFHGEVLSTGSNASAKFLYGTVSGTYTDSISATPGTITDGSVTAISAVTATALSPGTVYYAKVASTNASVYHRSGETSFMTMSSSPGNALHLDGSNDYVSVPDNNALDLTSTYTIEAWIKPEGFNGLAGIVSKYQASGNDGYFIRLTSDNPYTGIGFDGLQTANGILSAGNWYHIAAVNAGGTRTLYVNGSPVSLTGTPDNIQSNSSFLGIGVDFLEGARYFNGVIDEVRIWNVARTQQEIQDNKNTPFASAQSGLVGYWQFNANTGSVAQGHGSDARNGTLNNFNFDANSGWLSSEAPLPVELTSFTATSVRLNTELKWKTATELNNHGYEIERTVVDRQASKEKGAATTTSWTKVGFVEGNGTSNSPNEYAFTDKVHRAGKYSYRLKQIDRDGKFAYSQEVEVTVGTVPLEFALEQNYPNPFNPSTTIGFTLLNSGLTTLKIYNVVGQEVATLVNEVLEPGVFHQAQFNAGNLSSGVYFARLVSGSKVQVKKLMLMK
jgi:hypothetical protein